MTDSVRIDTSSFAKFSRDLRKADPILAKKFRTALKQAGEIVAVQARVNSSWSSRIPKTVKVRAAGTRVRVIAGDARGEAAAFEHHGVPGKFRHPVFGHREVWVSQTARPFLRPAAEMHRNTVMAFARKALNETFREAGFK